MLECLETASINIFESNERIEFLKIEALMSAEWRFSFLFPTYLGRSKETLFTG